MSYAQDYLDVVKATYHTATLGNVDNDEETDVGNANIEVYFPLPLTSDITLISGFTYENTRLSLNNSISRTNLIMTRLNLGVKLDPVSYTHLTLPTICSV